MEWAPPGLTSGRNLGNSTFACTVQWCMQICHKPLSPSVQDQKLWNRLPRLEKDLNSFLSSGSKVVEWSSQGLTSHGHFWNSTFACTVQWCMQICHKPLSYHLRTTQIENVNLLYFLLKMHIWMAVLPPNIAGNPIKDINVNLISEFRIQSCGMEPLQDWHLMDIFEILLLHVLSNDACKFAINLEKDLNSFLSPFRIKSCGTDPPDWKKI